MTHSSKLSLHVPALTGITLLALALGGSTALWAQAVVILLASLVILIFPPRTSPEIVPFLLCLLFFALAVSAFLPVDWAPLPEWRRHLTQDFHLPLGDLRTPQPWLTIQACGLLLFGLVWALYLVSQDWNTEEKSAALRLLTVGILFLAGLSIISYATGLRIPGWNEEQNRGWFPNRNQTADVLALGGIINYAIFFRSIQNRRWSGGFWLAGVGLIGAALVISYSRAGILIFFGGIALWHTGSIFRPGRGKRFAIGLSLMLILLSLFLLFGGSTLERFLNVPDSDIASTGEYRVLIQEDALRTSFHSPFLGVGLGNFEPVFTSMRQASADQNRTIHPESDWLWMAVEMGWFAPLLILIGIVWWTRQCLPFVRKPGEALRRAAMVAVIVFLIHGFVDVSGHRLGSLGVALFLAGVALSPARPLIPGWWPTPLFRGLALVTLLISVWWLASCFTDEVPPTTATLARVEEKLATAATNRQLASMGQYANAALHIAPLDWTFYFRRATAEAFRTGATNQAVTDFQVARYLEPNWVDLCLNEGEIWMISGDTDRCLAAWHESLHRAKSNSAHLYAAMLNLSRDNATVHAGLREMADTNIEYLVTFLAYATPDESKTELDGLLSHDPNLASLTNAQRKRLFSAWYDHGDRDALADQLLQHDDWQKTGWTYLVRHYAEQNDFEMATITSLRYLTPPLLPQIPADISLTEMNESFVRHPDDPATGLMLCRAQIQNKQPDAALGTIALLENLKGCPPSAFYLKAQIYADQKQWQDAWNALQFFQSGSATRLTNAPPSP